MRVGGGGLPAAAVRSLRSVVCLAVSAAAVAFALFSLSSRSTDMALRPVAGGISLLWFHGLGDSGHANEPIRQFFRNPALKAARWAFPSAPLSPVSCNHGAVMHSWFDIHELPLTAASPNDEGGVIEAVQDVHSMIDREIAAGIHPKNIFVCGFSQGGALTLASVMLYPKTLGGGAVFSGWVPFNSSIIDRVPSDAKKTPILWLHGMADRTVLYEAGLAGPPFLHGLGMSCDFKAYPNLGHSIIAEELSALESWITARLNGAPKPEIQGPKRM